LQQQKNSSAIKLLLRDHSAAIHRFNSPLLDQQQLFKVTRQRKKTTTTKMVKRRRRQRSGREDTRNSKPWQRFAFVF
jgi:hypothetical protein